MRSARTLSWIAGLALALAGPAEAQPRRGGAGPAGAAATSERRDQLKKRIRLKRAYALTEALALDEVAATRLFPVFARFDVETDKLLEKRVELQRRLKQADTVRDPRSIERLIDEAVVNQRGFWDLEDRRLAELRKILTPPQTAKLLVVMPALERQIQNQLRRAIIQASRHGNAGRAGASLDDDEQDDDEQDADEPRSRGPEPAAPARREAPLPRRGASNAPGNTPPCDPNTEVCR
jgi:hypothetical protein